MNEEARMAAVVASKNKEDSGCSKNNKLARETAAAAMASQCCRMKQIRVELMGCWWAMPSGLGELRE